MQRAINLKEKNKKPATNSWANVQNRSSLENKIDFKILYLRNDEDQSVEVVESPIINFNEVIEQLRLGHSIFIAPKNQTGNKLARRKKSKQQMHNYISHV